MINQNLFGLRVLALKTYSALIAHCRSTPVVTEEIKKTRAGLQRISEDYIAGFSQLYLSGTDPSTSPISDADRHQILITLQDFASISKSVRMSNKFLTNFADLMTRFIPNAMGMRLVSDPQAQRELEVMRAMMEKVKLTKENYMSLMKGLKEFIQCQATQKQAYKLLAKIIEKYELENLEELVQIQKEINPLLVGQASKQRVMLIQSYVLQMNKFKENPALMINILKSVVIDLITGYSSPNNKLRTLSEEVITSIFNLLNELKSLPQLFQLLLVGFAGTKAQTKSATIRALMLVFTINYKQQGLAIEDPSFQDFLRKVSKIVALYLRDERAEAEIHRASLRFLKTSIAFLTVDQLNKDLLDQVLANGIFALPPAKRGKHLALIRKLIGKLLKKIGHAAVKKLTPVKHLPLIEYIERARRKRTNKAKRNKLLALLGQPIPEQQQAQPKKLNEDSDSDDEMDSDDGEGEIEEHFSDDEGDSQEGESDDESASSSDDDQQEEVKGADHLMTDTIDIPRVDNIPVVSKLAKEKKIEQSGRSKLNQLEESKQKVKQLMQAEEEEYESHFVENPFIRMRERALQR